MAIVMPPCCTHHPTKQYHIGLLVTTKYQLVYQLQTFTKKLIAQQMLKIQKILTKHRFNIDLYGIRKYCRHYYFKCAEANCNKSFNKVHDWNMHHRIIHKYKLKCELCGKKFVSPSAHRAHRNYHVPCKYSCTLCDKTFAFQSRLKQHKTVHTRSRLHRCFSGTCTKAFKWPQDLVRHIKHHMQGRWLCNS